MLPVIRDKAGRELHGETGTPLYKQWEVLKWRAKNREECEVEFTSYADFKDWALNNGWVKGLSVCRNGDVGNYSRTNCRMDTIQSNTEEVMAKTYTFLSPDGEEITFFNMRKFCRENGLDSSGMVKVSKGKITNHKGWKFIR